MSNGLCHASRLAAAFVLAAVFSGCLDYGGTSAEERGVLDFAAPVKAPAPGPGMTGVVPV